MIRPEVRTALVRWREVIALALVALVGAWIATRGGWFLAVVGGVILLTMLVLVRGAVQRLRFAGDADGPGMVEVDEGQVAWYGPGVGGFIALEQLAELGLVSMHGMRVWRLRQTDGQILFVPVAAQGTERLFDALMALPGIDGQRLLAAMDATSDNPFLWRRRYNLSVDLT